MEETMNEKIKALVKSYFEQLKPLTDSDSHDLVEAALDRAIREAWWQSQEFREAEMKRYREEIVLLDGLAKANSPIVQAKIIQLEAENDRLRKALAGTG